MAAGIAFRPCPAPLAQAAGDCEEAKAQMSSSWASRTGGLRHVYEVVTASQEDGHGDLEALTGYTSDSPSDLLRWGEGAERPSSWCVARAARLAAGGLAVASFFGLAALGATPRWDAAVPQMVPEERLESRPIRLDEEDSAWAGAGKCGIATNMLDYNQAGIETFCGMNLDFWWNRAPHLRSSHDDTCAMDTFIPSIWGPHPENGAVAEKAGKEFDALMGYNEPDRWGAPPHSSGATEAFHCSSHVLAKDWRDVIISFRKANPQGIILSPAVADPLRSASTGGLPLACNDSPQSWAHHLPWCPGWLRCFKENVIQFDCGGVNCWDAIDVLQFHAFEYDADKLIDKVRTWETLWSEELLGINGRSKKTLWLTEFARAGAEDSSDPDGETAAFMDQAVDYLKASPFVSGWSWFSQTFTAFEIDGKAPKSKLWSTELINQTGALTPIGRRYQELCAMIPAEPRELVVV